MADEIAVSGTTEATPSTGSESSSPSTQAEGTQATQPETPKSPPNWRETHRTDPTLNDYIQSQIKRATDKAEQRRLRDEAKAVVESKDSARALEITNRVASQVDPEDEGQTQFLEKARTAASSIDRLRATDEYAQVWKEHGKAAMDAKWFEDPEGYADWVQEQVIDLRATTRAKKIALELAKAMSTEQTTEALKNVATPMAGGASGSGRLTLEAYLAMPSRERLQLRKTSPDLIDDLVNRASR